MSYIKSPIIKQALIHANHSPFGADDEDDSLVGLAGFGGFSPGGGKAANIRR